VVDDAGARSRTLRELRFELEGYRIIRGFGRAGGLHARLAESVHLVTLDLNLGGENGLELARQVRARCNVPIVMITGKGDTIDRVVGLELGADDYIAKPFHVREVLARARAVLRRYDGAVVAPDAGATAPENECLAFETWSLDMTRRELRSDDGRVQELTTAEYNMLELFVRRPSRVLSRDNIMDLLKGHEWSPLDRSIDALIVRLRRKVEADPESPRLIKTVRGVGYVFAGEVRRR
jgi:DNA-binding response OmpR family regulator